MGEYKFKKYVKDEEYNEILLKEDASYYATLMVAVSYLNYKNSYYSEIDSMNDYIKDRQNKIKKFTGFNIKFEDISEEPERIDYYENLPEETYTGYNKKYIATIFTSKEIKFELDCGLYASGVPYEIKAKCIDPFNYEEISRYLHNEKHSEELDSRDYMDLSIYEQYLKLVNKIKNDYNKPKTSIDKFNKKYNRSQDSQIKDEEIENFENKITPGKGKILWELMGFADIDTTDAIITALKENKVTNYEYDRKNHKWINVDFLLNEEIADKIFDRTREIMIQIYNWKIEDGMKITDEEKEQINTLRIKEHHYFDSKIKDDSLELLRQELKDKIKNFFLKKGYKESDLLDTKLDDMFITCHKSNGGYYLIDIDANIKGLEVSELAKYLTPTIQNINPNAKFDAKGISGSKNCISAVFKDSVKGKDAMSYNWKELINDNEFVSANSFAIRFKNCEIETIPTEVGKAVHGEDSREFGIEYYIDDIPVTSIEIIYIGENDSIDPETLSEEEYKNFVDAMYDCQKASDSYVEIAIEEWKRIDEEKNGYYEDSKPIKDNKIVNESITKFINELEMSLKSSYNLAKQLGDKIPNEQATTNKEKELYNGKYIKTFESITESIKIWYKELEEFKKELANAHIVVDEVLEEFPLKARNALRESDNKEETYKALIENLKQIYYSIENREQYKDRIVKIKKDLDGFYKNTFKK